MIYFRDIFDRAFSLFDDPDISTKYYIDDAGFQADMLDYLIIGKNKFNSPTAITDKLIICDGPSGEMITIDGEDTATYVLESRPKEGSGFTFRIEGEKVRGTYNPENNSVTFSRSVLKGETCSVT